MRFQLFAARLGLGLWMLAGLGALAALAGVRLGFMPIAQGLEVMTAATGLGLGALALALAWGIKAFNRNRGEGKRAGLIALVGSLALLAPVAHAVYGEMTSPAIHDATTSPEDPPLFVALARARQPGMNSARYDGSQIISFRGETNTADYMIHTYYATTVARPYARLLTTKSKLFWHAFETVKKLGWRIVDYSEKEGRIEATTQSFWFGQSADIVVRVREAGAQGARLDARSQSETGTRDFGENITRLKDLLGAL